MARHTIDDVEVIHATSQAILIACDELGEEWIPNAAVHNDSEVWVSDAETRVSERLSTYTGSLSVWSAS